MAKYAEKILEIVESRCSHPTAEEIFYALRRDYPRVVRATVYNNLHRLCKEQRIAKVSLAGMPDRYDRIARHDHLVCQKCGRVVDIELPDLTKQLEEQAGQPLLSYDLKLFYLCEDCRPAGRQADVVAVDSAASASSGDIG